MAWAKIPCRTLIKPSSSGVSRRRSRFTSASTRGSCSCESSLMLVISSARATRLDERSSPKPEGILFVPTCTEPSRGCRRPRTMPHPNEQALTSSKPNLLQKRRLVSRVNPANERAEVRKLTSNSVRKSGHLNPRTLVPLDETREHVCTDRMNQGEIA